MTDRKPTEAAMRAAQCVLASIEREHEGFHYVEVPQGPDDFAARIDSAADLPELEAVVDAARQCQDCPNVVAGHGCPGCEVCDLRARLAALDAKLAEREE